jgi:hypothetical protein
MSLVGEFVELASGDRNRDEEDPIPRVVTSVEFATSESRLSLPAKMFASVVHERGVVRRRNRRVLFQEPLIQRELANREDSTSDRCLQGANECSDGSDHWKRDRRKPIPVVHRRTDCESCGCFP